MGSTTQNAVPVLVVCSEGWVRWRMGEPTTTRGLFVVADCSTWEGDAPAVAGHLHGRWRVQTDSGYLVGYLSLTTRREAQAAAAALGSGSV